MAERKTTEERFWAKVDKDGPCPSKNVEARPMKGPEKRIVDCIRAYLRSRPYTWHFKVGVAGWQVSGLPDVIGCTDGRFFALEVKQPGKSATPLQAATLAAIKRAGGIAETVTSLDQVKFVLDGPQDVETAEETIARLQAMVDLLEANLGYPEG